MIIVDVETTGHDAKKHSIVSIGAIDLNNPKNTFYVENRIWDGAEILKGDPLLPGLKPALEINGFIESEIIDPKKLLLKEAMELFFKWIENCNTKVLAGHNPYFDLDFLRTSTLMHNIKWTLGYSAVDLYSAVYLSYKQRGLQPPEKLKGNECLNYTGLPIEAIPHNALTGAKMEAEAFNRLIYGKNLLEEFKQYPVPDYLVKN